jgi:SSS family solute:Na+ symporter
MVNSASTIFTLDIYKNLFVKSNSDQHYVKIGRLSSAGALLLGAFIAPALGSLDQVFQYIQEYTGFISPGVVAVFLFGMFWKRATANSALVAVVASIPFSWMMQALFPEVPFLVRMALSFVVMSGLVVVISVFENKASETRRAKETPFLLGLVGSIILISVPAGVRILVGDIETSNVFGLLILGLSGIIFALLFTENKLDDKKAIDLNVSLFKTDSMFNISTMIVCLILVLIYGILW